MNLMTACSVSSRKIEMADRRSRRRGDLQAKTRNNWDELDTQEAINYCRSGADRAGLEVKFINNHIGRGVFATKEFHRKEFILEYAGDLITKKEAIRRETEYCETEGSFMYFFRTGTKSLCVDATLDPFDLTKGRLVNDGCGNEANSKMVIVVIDGTPRLCLFALRDISAGQEIRYDYGVPNLPWWKKPQQTMIIQKKPKTEIEAETDEGEEGASEDENDETSAESTREHVHVQQTTPRPAKQKDGKRKKKLRSSQVHDSSAKRPIQKRSWTDAEVAAVKRNFDSLIRIQKLPGKREIEACKAKEASLHGRSWRNIKDFIRHQIKTRKKNAFY